MSSTHNYFIKLCLHLSSLAFWPGKKKWVDFNDICYNKEITDSALMKIFIFASIACILRQFLIWLLHSNCNEI